MWRNVNLVELDEEFLSFLKEDAHLLKEKRHSETPLTSNEIIHFATKLESFIIHRFQLNLSNINEKYLKFDKKANVKRDFVQRKVVAYYKNFEGEIPEFLDEDEFVKIVLEGKREEEMKHYARFALFHELGIKYHKNGSVFKVPQKNKIPFESTEEEVKYTGTSEFYKTEEQNFGMVKYCIYCHKQKRDYCRTHNPISHTQGCPLDQKISEMNILKSKGLIFAPLVTMMIDNPLCILTGHRICNDCKKACIFQKQTPVDVPSIESEIVKNVLDLPFGFEIYFLFTEWNPLLTKSFLPKELNGKSVLVCGAGPAGILSSYYFLKEGFEVLLIDGLKLNKINAPLVIENANEILQKGIRQNKGFGGVMEYGITDRWNKNFLILAQIILERKQGFSILGGKKFGTDITFDWAKKQGFCHVLMCIGAGKPKLPNMQINLEQNIITASNFLMSCHLNKGWALQKIKSPILIIGAGLTGIDCALFAKKNGHEVYLIARTSLEDSRAFKGNDLEVEDALSNGVKIFENRILKEVIKDKFCIFTNTITQKDEIWEFGLLVFALGTEPNIEPVQTYDDTSFFTILGDLDKKYEGSVVKAFASVKNKKDEIFAKLTNSNSNLYRAKRDMIISKKIDGSSLTLKVKLAIHPVNPNIFDVYKLQILNTDLHPIPLTLLEYDDEGLTFIVKNEGEGTAKLFENCDILLTKASSNPYNFARVVVEDEAFLRIKNSILLKDFKETGENTLFYIKDFSKIKRWTQNNYYVFLFREMNCMLSGVCSRCLTQNSKGEFFYACKQNILKVRDLHH